ncbi:MAG: hypothetical protein EB127_30350 [Alphaproteobacteria bacterium]|nr:hypothetical protein [Alphaproteobacteria bacterium]
MTNHDVAVVESGCLTDESVNFCISYICSQSKRKDKILPFSSLFYAKVTADPNQIVRHDFVKRWTKNRDIFDKDVLLFTVHKNFHWSLIIVIKPSLVRKYCPYLSSDQMK